MPLSHQNSGTLLIVDDNEDHRDLLCRRLSRKGYVTIAAAGGREALTRLETQPFDLVLLDVMMPDINGLTVLKTLRQTHTAAALPGISARQSGTSCWSPLHSGSKAVCGAVIP
jgi:CheY-like chemotaxis protein